ncbi:hypothetical protein [Gluconobacter cerinus]|uniref:hypothetical protein n=1 Tax=Gluconobacter cerinus TaxID=38307 RepID=UPI001B8CDEF4|nr:hypothetical protein [Gluconobacter cerinus]MBS1026137.1 hypothetical protein [Gluconobacter cerinus]MBS1044568.1 hypothetical protein [Gluconobacter cerinus]
MSDINIVPPSPGAYAVVCEHVRHEAGGKKTFIGVSSGTFSIEEDQEAISFDLYVNLQFPSSCHPETMQVAVCRNNTVIAVPIKKHKIVYSKANKAKNKEADSVAVEGLEAVTSLQGLKFSDGDLLIILVGLDDKSYVAANLNVNSTKRRPQ